MSEVSEEVIARGVDGSAGGAGEGRSRPIVTLFESYGSGAAYVGRAVAVGLGVPFHEQAFSSEQLEESGQRREKDGLLMRMFDAMGSASFGGVDVGDVASAQRDRYDLVMENTATVQKWAASGGVIVGRNGAFILADRPGALHVMLDGPLEQRIARAAQEAGISLERAAKRQKNEDRVRAEMSIKLYDWDPRDPTRYDLVVNTGRMDLDTCAAIIVDACQIRTGHRIG
jgi:cytidylate kinase